jgi:tetratricopeptide (TPR) repeat protein
LTDVKNTHLLISHSVDSKVAPQPDYSGHYSFSSFGPVSTYVNRPGLHDRIKEQLHDRLEETEPGARILVVWGLGGAGKSQLVLNYLQECRSDYSAAFWVETGQKESLERDFLQIYRLLYGLREGQGESMVKIDDAVLAVKNWFHGRDGRWLLVFDSADAIDDKDDAGYIDLKHYFPTAPSVHIIVTTRSSKAKGMTRLSSVKVGSMELLEAVELFSVCSEHNRTAHENQAKIEAIVQELGCLALAITLAGSYVAEMHLELDEYLEEYRQRRKDLLGEVPESLIHEYSESVLTTWESSFQAITKRNTEASRLLTLLAFIHYDDILLDLFEPARNTTPEDGTNDKDLNDNQSLWQLALSSQKPVDMHMIKQAFRVLESFSLIQWKKDQRSHAIHKLVHTWAYERLDHQEHVTFCLAALVLLATAVENWPADPQSKTRLIPHLMANFGIVSHVYRIVDSDNRPILDLFGIISGFLNGAGRWTEVCAVETFQLNQTKNLYGCDHVDTLSVMSNLAATLGDQGKLKEAASMKKEVLEKRRRILGDEHPDTLSAMNNLANTLGQQGKLEEAASIQKKVLEKRIRILSDEHPDTLSAMSNLANTLGEQGQLDETASIQREVLEKRRRILSDEHPDTLKAMNNLANTLSEQGQLDEAASIQREVLEKRRRILGDEHPSTPSAMSNLAATLSNQGKLDEAASMKKEVLEKRRRILGDEHPNTLSAMSNLAATLSNQGKLDEAASIQKKVMEKRIRILGDEHPNTLSAMSNLAATLGEQGQLDEAVSMKKEVLEKRRKILGDEHPDTLKAMNNLAVSLAQMGDLNSAVPIFEDVLEKRRQILGELHPDTISTSNTLRIVMELKRNQTERS